MYYCMYLLYWQCIYCTVLFYSFVQTDADMSNKCLLLGYNVIPIGWMVNRYQMKEDGIPNIYFSILRICVSSV